MASYAAMEPASPEHPMVSDSMDTAKSVEMDLSNAQENWINRRDELVAIRRAHINSAELLETAINRINYFLREDRAETTAAKMPKEY